MDAPDSLAYLPLLKEVSRSFYLTVRILPRAIRPQISVAYLLARATDTIADTEIVPVAERLKGLGELREQILRSVASPRPSPPKGERENKSPVTEQHSRRLQAEPISVTSHDTTALAPKNPPTGPSFPLSPIGGEGRGEGATAGEHLLLSKIENILTALNSFSPSDQQLIRNVLATIINGQELDLIRFGEASPKNIQALSSPDELEDYTYRVAGCVGEFWTRISRAHLFPNASLDAERLIAQGIQFGKGLQLVNVLRDLPRDLRKGRCYLPKSELLAAAVNPADLLNSSSQPALRPMYTQWLDRAQTYLAAGWTYTNTLPKRCVRLRLACAWPILIGGKTIEALRHAPILDPERRIRISRGAVRGIMLSTVLLYPFPPLWGRQFRPNSS